MDSKIRSRGREPGDAGRGESLGTLDAHQTLDTALGLYSGEAGNAFKRKQGSGTSASNELAGDNFGDSEGMFEGGVT